MKKTLLSIIAVAGISLFSAAQVEMYLNGGVTDVSGTTIQISPENSNTIVSDIDIENSTGVTKDWVITRLRINEQATWVDYLCWGHETDPFGGICYPASTMNSTSWETPTSVSIADGEGGTLQSDITPDPQVDGCVTYRYYVHEAGQAFEDSIDIEICFSLGLNEITPEFTVNIAPNPASNNITVNTTGVNNATIKMVDVLGNVVLEQSSNGSTTNINISDFRHGVYFITIEAEGVKPVNRQVLIRH